MFKSTGKKQKNDAGANRKFKSIFDLDNGDFNLTVNSPCIDAGASIVSTGNTPGGNSYAQAPLGFDMDGDSRPRDNGYDIGADEYPGPEYWTPDRMRNAVPAPMEIPAQ